MLVIQELRRLMQEDRAGAQDGLPTKTLAPNSKKWGGVERKHEHTMTDGSTSEQQKLYRHRNV